MLLRGKTAIITGAASPRGIGLATARRFAAEGARVAILDIDGSAAEAAARGLESGTGEPHRPQNDARYGGGLLRSGASYLRISSSPWRR